MSEVVHIKGIHGVSMIDFPGHVSSVVFVGGCSFRCPFCHNPDLVTGADTIPDIDESDALQFLANRRSFIDGVVISGGEPTLYPGVVSLIERIREMGLLIKLDTNGYHPACLKRLVDEKLVDFVAMDVKAPLARYPEAAGKLVDLAQLEQSIDLLRTASVAVEFRTTVVPGLIDRDDIVAIAKRIRGAPRYVLQQFTTPILLDPAYAERAAVDPETLRLWAEGARPYVETVDVRGI